MSVRINHNVDTTSGVHVVVIVDGARQLLPKLFRQFFNDEDGFRSDLHSLDVPFIRSRELIIYALEASSAKVNWTELGGEIGEFLRKSNFSNVAVHVCMEQAQTTPVFDQLLFGAHLELYEFDRYKSIDTRPMKKELALSVPSDTGLDEWHKRLLPLTNGISLARDLVNEPPNELTPRSFVDRCLELQSLGVEVEVFDETEIASAGLNGILMVGRGSVEPSYVVRMTYRHISGDAEPGVFVGKGVCFDSGGLSLKPTDRIHRMKRDMAGAAAVVGLMKAVAESQIETTIVGIVGVAENMPSGAAMRPSDILRTLSGHTVEIENTDYEGRLILCDLLTWAQRTLHPRYIVDLATLTGAVVLALGHAHAGLFGNDDDLVHQLLSSAGVANEALWRLPIGEQYDEELRSTVADFKNVGTTTAAGAGVGARFLETFIEPGTSWAHLDITGTAWADKPRRCVPAGATGFGVRLLEQFVRMDSRQNRCNELQPDTSTGLPTSSTLPCRASARTPKGRM
ncbi:leucyl aminopeptidase family protein [Sinorhizobium meliloti]|uniref:leucyl aminopeptidase family protein n=1 Tax=Rhizobium meliloti TaxID=382 RepID=UPI00041B2C77|nr:leucyl aminopeptidase family protein [Sinorhizobium meliloti]ARS65912.1 hypothetical protein SMRU11_00110 [Sinorhizobium meliloti RU11/001]RVG85627.1 leucyl aminopeptidase family protein [Sinorhizobium meliloti]RVH56711.1 leucyl aminopeptidase family protein [Sinorhizobium meliloti]